jgi:hypothetical protein
MSLTSCDYLRYSLGHEPKKFEKIRSANLSRVLLENSKYLKYRIIFSQNNSLISVDILPSFDTLKLPTFKSNQCRHVVRCTYFIHRRATIRWNSLQILSVYLKFPSKTPPCARLCVIIVKCASLSKISSVMALAPSLSSPKNQRTWLEHPTHLSSHFLTPLKSGILITLLLPPTSYAHLLFVE